MKMPISEIVDKYTILLLKQEHLKEEKLDEQVTVYREEVLKYPNLEKYVHLLSDIHREIWKLEADIRKGKEKEIGLEEVGRRAIRIRDWNKKRVFIKNKIVEESGEGFKDVKVNHASEEDIK